MSSDTYITLSFSPIRFHAITPHSGRRDEDVLNKEEHSSQEGSVDSNAKAPQTSANGYGVAPETDTIVKANGLCDILLTFAGLCVC